MNQVPHIDVCICTYRRPRLLARLLEDLGRQPTDGRFTYSIVVADNDSARSAEAVVRGWADRSPIPIRYCVESQQNIALARNKAIEHAEGEFVAFIDDDEFPSPRWLLTLFDACGRHAVDGVLGPVKPHYDETPPAWVVAGRFYDRPTYPTGYVIDWRKGRTGNVLLTRHVFGDAPPFRPEFLTGEDQDFFRRAIEKGYVFIWCDEAVAYESVPPERWRRRFMLRRALLRGSVSLRHPASRSAAVLKSLVAAPAYTLALPVAFVLGRGAFMTCLIKLCDHAGRLLSLAGIDPIGEPYVTQ